MTRRLGLAVVAVLALGGCRHKERLAPVDFNAEAAVGDVDREATLAPAWPAPIRAKLDNGAILQWLVETEAPVFNVRLVLPLRPEAKLDAATTSVVAAALQIDLTRRLRRQGAQVGVQQRAGRIELFIRGYDEDAQIILNTLTSALANRKPERVLAQAQGKTTASFRAPDASGRAAATLAATLLGLDPSAELAEKEAIVALARPRLEKGWQTLLDPKGSVIIVHAGRAPEELSDAVRRLAGTWNSRGLRSGSDGVLERVRGPAPGKRGTRILAEPQAPLVIVDAQTQGRPVLMFGRVIPTPTTKDRALARLTQRMLQEEVDARLVVAGDVSLFSVRVPLTGRAPDKSVAKVIERLDRFAATEHQPERMRQATQLWLGARVVEASFEAEDWTSLWSESLDLANDDTDIGVALARDARAMLEADPKTVRKWQEKWLLPRGGEPGWAWVAAGVTPEIQEKLAQLAPLAPGA